MRIRVSTFGSLSNADFPNSQARPCSHAFAFSSFLTETQPEPKSPNYNVRTYRRLFNPDYSTETRPGWVPVRSRAKCMPSVPNFSTLLKDILGHTIAPRHQKKVGEGKWWLWNLCVKINRSTCKGDYRRPKLCHVAESWWGCQPQERLARGNEE